MINLLVISNMNLIINMRLRQKKCIDILKVINVDFSRYTNELI